MALRARTLALATGCALILNGSVEATTLRDALGAAYTDNPTLTAQRAAQRATDEQYGIVRAGGLPQLSGSATATQGVRNYRDIGSFNRLIGVGGNLSLPIWQGGRIRNALHAADARVAAGQQTLRATEGDVFVSVVSAYMDVLRDRAIVDLNVNNLHVLEINLQATQDQFAAGSLTRTDVAQSTARLEGARSQLAAARATLTASEENYRAVVGRAAGAIEPPPEMPLLPTSADSAEATALDENPGIAAAAQAVRAAHLDVSTQRANRLPIVTGNATSQYFNYSGAALIPAQRGDYATVGVTATLPLYQGGLVGAQVRQAQAFEQQAIENQTATERQVVVAVRSSFASYNALLDTERASTEQVKANTLALEGLRAEQSVGLRQVLDVLNGEQELLSSKVTLVSAQHDAYIAGFQLLNAMGLVNSKRLGLDGGALYDPQVHYARTRRRIGDWDEDPRPAPQARPVYGPAVPPQIPPVTPLGN